MKNEDVIDLLNEIADLLELKGESAFRVRAYRIAARSIEGLHENVAKLAEENRLTEVHGIGESIAEKIRECVLTGHSTYREELAEELPPNISELLEIPGVGASKVRMVHEKLGVTTVGQLEEAANSHKLHKLPGFGEKTEQNILRGIQILKQRTGRMLLGTAWPAAEEIVELMKENPAVEQIEMGGSIRRKKETIGDIDILVSSSNAGNAIKAFTSLPNVRSVIAEGSTKASVVTDANFQIDLRVVSPDEWGAALQYFTGSKNHNISTRSIAEKFGLKINEYGVFRIKTNEKIAGKTEEEVYSVLGMDWMPPEIRENSGEIEAALKHKLPDLIEVTDIRGDLHAHTDWSDGHNTIEEMAEAAMERGYEYLAISDHSASMTFINGLSIERIREQRKIIDDLNRQYNGFRLLHGIEVNIRGDSTMDYEDDILAQFDVVTASIHTGLGQSEERITERMLAAIRNPNIDIIGHPSGRIIDKREASAFDRKAVFQAAAETGTAMEINSQPDRLDLKDTDARYATELGAMVAIDSDSHTRGQLGLIRYGVATARRGWVTKDHVLNALPINKLLEKLGTCKG